MLAKKYKRCYTLSKSNTQRVSINMADSQPHHIGTLSPEMALLGLLYEAPGHGYDLHRKVIADLGQVWHLSQSQAYSILKRLELRGDISVEEIPQEKLPARQLFYMTEQGRSHFLAWLETPTGGRTRAIRMEFVTRLYFLHLYMPEKLPFAFEQQKMEAKAHIQRLEKMRADLPVEQIYNCMSLDMRLKQLRLVLEWLDECWAYLQSESHPQ
jgi:DNA-binding PadR family transcriptional regulator